MKHGRRIIPCITYIIFGVVLMILGILEIVDSFWSGMGGALIAVGVVRMIHILRYHSDESYREKKQIEQTDERNRFIRNKAWAWTGYLYVLIASVATIVLRVMDEDLLATAAGMTVCLVLVLYWVSYYVLKRKY